MKTLRLILVLIVLAAPALAQEMGTSAGHDLDALWQRARDTLDLDREDAVVLLESRTVTVDDEGTVATRVHRVVWIATSRAIREQADLRVPWLADTSTLDVELLRTWRDGRWWPDPRRISDTAVVETLPHALDRADDLTGMRETMLLHDGVELPCILETAYTVAVQGPPTAGADDLFVFARRDPAVRVDYTLRLPRGLPLRHASLGGAPRPAEDEDGVRTLHWRMEDVPPLTLPLTAQPADHEPALVWTTWSDWAGLEAAWSAAVDPAAVAGAEATAALDAHLAGSLDPVRDTVAFWNEAVRPVHYPWRFWRLAPRPADRVWATGYGHALDRAVLLRALLEHVAAARGDTATRVAVVRTERGYGEVARDLPRLAGYDGLRVEVGEGGLGTWMIDPADGRVLDEVPLDTWARTRLGWTENVRRERRLILSLEPDDGGGWAGAGLLRLNNGWGFHAALYGDAEDLAERVRTMVGSVLPEAEVADIARAGGDLRFAVTVAAPPRNHRDEPQLVLGPLADGVLDNLPADVHLWEQTRQTPLRIPRNLREQVELRLHVEDRPVRAPEPVLRSGPVGRFAVDVERAHGWLTVRRTLDLAPAGEPAGWSYGDPARYLHPASAWPALRALLLEAGDPAHGTVVLEDTGS